MAPEVASDPTVAGAMRGLSALRLLAHHLQELPEVSLGVDVSDWRDSEPVLRIQLHQQSTAIQLTRLADGLGLPTPTTQVQPDGSTHCWSDGTWNGYQVRLVTVITDEVMADG